MEIEFNYCYNHNNYFIFVLRWYYFYEKLFKRILQATYIFYVRVTVNSNKVPFNKTNTRTNVPNLFYQEILHVSDSSSAHHQEFSIIHSATVCVMQFWWQLSSTNILVVLESCNQTCMTYTSAECTVENSWWWAEKLPETCRINLGISASVGFIKKKFVKIHGHMNVKNTYKQPYQRPEPRRPTKDAPNCHYYLPNALSERCVLCERWYYNLHRSKRVKSIN